MNRFFAEGCNALIPRTPFAGTAIGKGARPCWTLTFHSEPGITSSPCRTAIFLNASGRHQRSSYPPEGLEFWAGGDHREQGRGQRARFSSSSNLQGSGPRSLVEHLPFSAYFFGAFQKAEQRRNAVQLLSCRTRGTRVRPASTPPAAPGA